MLDLNAFAKEVHAVSVAHGWWEKDDPDNNHDTKIALIHAEWSEALEEYRKGMPMVYALYDDGAVETDAAKFEGRKPEGIAVELIDGVLRIMDLCEGVGEALNWQNARQECERRATQLRDDMSFGALISTAHTLTTMSAVEEDAVHAAAAAVLVLAWVAKQGTDPWELLHIKHEYNKTRPYKHGGKRC